MTKSWLVYDIGTGSTKAALIQAGQVIQTASASYETHFGEHGIVEQNADDWWSAFQTTTRELDTASVDGIILTGQMQDLILLDDESNPIRPVILYNDTRATAEMTQIEQALDMTVLITLTGNHQNAGGLLPKLLWLQQHEPDALVTARHLVLGASDYIVAKLTGQFVSDSTTVATTGLWNLHTRTLLDNSILKPIELGPIASIFPQVVDGGTQVGTISAHVATSLDLPANTPVYLAPGDAGSATIGAGSGEIGNAYAYVGTSGWVGFSADQAGNPDEGVITLTHPKADHFIQVAPMMTSAGNLDWVRDLFDADDHENVIKMGLDGKLTHLIYLPYLNGERAPFSDPFARGTFIGLTQQSTKADVYRAVLEGVIFAYKHTLSALSPQPPAHLTIIGGGAQSVTWCQLFADILGIPVHIRADAENAGLLGALRSVEVKLGLAKDYDLGANENTQILPPMTNHADVYAAKYDLFLKSYRALKPIFEDMSKL